MSFRQTLKMSLAASAAAALAVVAAPFVAAPASAADDGKKIPPTMLVLDGSYSMVEKDVDGRARIDVAKEAANKVLTKIGDATDVGLLTYGTKVSNGPDDKVEGCKDITLLAEPVSGKVDELKDKVNEVTPKGFTPIGKALQAAAEALPDSGDRTIVLVSDGADTCAPPPVCEVAQELARNGVDLVINTVGLLVDKTAREELECIAEATGGSYADAKDAEQLIQGVEEAATGQKVGGGSRGNTVPGTGGESTGVGGGAYEPTSPELEGATSKDAAPEVPSDYTSFRTTITPNGSSDADADSLIYQGANSPDWLQAWWIPVTEGERITVAVNSLPTDDGPGQRDFLDFLGGNILVNGKQSTHQGDTDPCIGFNHNSFQETTRAMSAGPKPGPVGIGNYGLVTEPFTGQCAADRVLLVLYTEGGLRDGERVEPEVTDTPVEISLVRIGSVDLDSQPESVGEDPDQPAQYGDDDGSDRRPKAADAVRIPDTIDPDITAGRWFTEAGSLPADGSAAAESTISPGETQFFRVRAGYGQKAAVTVSGTPESTSTMNPYGTAGLDLRTFNPARLQVSDYWGAESWSRYSWEAVPIGINNFYDNDKGFGFANPSGGPWRKYTTVWLGGEQYFRVTYYDTAGKADTPITYRIAAQVEGEETEGPQFSSIVGPGEFAPEGSGDGNGTTNQASSGSSGGINGLGVATVVFAVLALVFAAAAVIRRQLLSSSAPASNPFTSDTEGWGR